MPNRSQQDGVCLACRFDSDCIYEAARHRILQCEQFEFAMPAPVPPLDSTSTRTAAFDDGDRPAGLCANCDFRDDCIYPKPEGGVWRCEEYR